MKSSAEISNVFTGKEASCLVSQKMNYVLYFSFIRLVLVDLADYGGPPRMAPHFCPNEIIFFKFLRFRLHRPLFQLFCIHHHPFLIHHLSSTSLRVPASIDIRRVVSLISSRKLLSSALCRIKRVTSLRSVTFQLSAR